MASDLSQMSRDADHVPQVSCETVRSSSPKVSVIIAAYGASKDLPGCVQTLQMQEMEDWEALIIDDASTDNTFDVASSLAAMDSRVTAHRLEVNGGPSAARNLGLRLAVGDWVAILDADDRLDPGRFALLLAQGSAAGCDLIFDNMAALQDDRSSEIPYWPNWGGRTTSIGLTEMLRGCAGGGLVHYGVLKPFVRRSFLLESGVRYDLRLRQGEDVHFHVSLMLAGAQTERNAAVGYLYSEPVSGDTSRASQTNLSHRLRATEMLVASSLGRLNTAQRFWISVRLRNTRNAESFSELSQAIRDRQLIRAVAVLLRAPWVGIQVGLRVASRFWS